MIKKFSLLFLFCCTLVHAEMKQPLKICSHIKENVAFQSMKVTKQKCDPTGVTMSEKSLYSAYMRMLSEKEASPSECNVQCLANDVLAGKKMSECVDSYAKTFAQTIGNGSFTAETCNSFKSRFVR